MTTWRNENTDSQDDELTLCQDCGNGHCADVEVCSDQVYRCCVCYIHAVKNEEIEQGAASIKFTCEGCFYHLRSLDKKYLSTNQQDK